MKFTAFAELCTYGKYALQKADGSSLFNPLQVFGLGFSCSQMQTREIMESRKTLTSSERRFTELQQQVLAAVGELYKHPSIAHDIANMVLLALSVQEDHKDQAALISSELDKASERYFSDLWNYCYRYALQYLKREDQAQDIAQDAIASLFRTDKEIDYIKGWLKRTVFNQVQTKIKSLDRESSFVALDIAELAAAIEPADLNELQQQIKEDEIKNYLSAQDYRMYRKIKSYPTIKAYSKANQLSYQTAREHHHRLLHNLKHNYLKKQGWSGTPQILNFRQLSNIKRFLRTLIEHAEQKSMDKLSKYCPKDILEHVESTLQNMKEATDWGIRMLDNRIFHIFVWDASEAGMPTSFIINIMINQGNSIRITDCREAKLMGMIGEDDMDVVPVDSGKCTLSMDEIRRMIR